jgi:photosystem II stability/assembly factor-like uncharacterized protein
VSCTDNLKGTAMRLCYTLIILFILTSTLLGQWQQTNGPTGAGAYNFCKSSGIIYVTAGTGGVFKSTNNGDNWLPANSGLEGRAFYSLVTRRDTIYAGATGIVSTGEAGAFRSVDHGATWTKINSGLSSPSVVSITADSTYLYVGLGYALGRSSNGGTSWTTITNGLPTSPYLWSLLKLGNTLLAGIDSRGIYASTDQGSSWSACNTGISATTSPLGFAVAGTSIFSVTYYDGVYRSDDTGKSWINVNNDFPVYHCSSVTSDGSNIYVASRDSGIYKTADNGQHWTSLNATLETRIINSISWFDGTLFAGTKFGVVKSTDAGATWIPSNSGIRGTDILSLAAGNGYQCAAVPAGIAISTDKGATWQTKMLDATIAWDGIALTGDTILAISSKGVHRSTDRGANWGFANSSLTSTNCHYIACEGTYAYVVTNEGVYYSNDAGATWSSKTNGLPSDCAANAGYLTCLSGKAYISGYSSVLGYRIVFAISHGATQWTDISTGYPASAGMNNIFLIDTTLFCSTGQGILKFNGSSWLSIIGNNQGKITWYKKRLLAFILDSPGIKLSADSGKTWMMYYNTGLTNMFVRTWALQGNDLFIGTAGAGVWYRRLDAPTFLNSGGVNFSKGITVGRPATQSFTISNVGFDSLRISSITCDNPVFTIQTTSCVVSPLGSVSIAVTFAPSVAGTFTGHIVVVSNDDGSPDTVSAAGTATGSSGVNDNDAIPHITQLHANYPNPFNPSTTIQYELAKTEYVVLQIFDVLGREVGMLISEIQIAGNHQASFNAQSLSSGVYFYKLTTSNFSQVKKMMLLK